MGTDNWPNWEGDREPDGSTPADEPVGNGVLTIAQLDNIRAAINNPYAGEWSDETVNDLVATLDLAKFFLDQVHPKTADYYACSVCDFLERG